MVSVTLVGDPVDLGVSHIIVTDWRHRLQSSIKSSLKVISLDPRVIIPVSISSRPSTKFNIDIVIYNPFRVQPFTSTDLLPIFINVNLYSQISNAYQYHGQGTGTVHGIFCKSKRLLNKSPTSHCKFPMSNTNSLNPCQPGVRER